ncbi:hypothetical protein RRF57_012448 [Xylaria bambusicola]|uniref:Uncharacterized protein n=1 Tax=Xylaria bambusicola TaxID=326684 RepID=A0AAN7V1R6_9PEZI
MLNREILDTILQKVIVQTAVLRMPELGEYHGRESRCVGTIAREGTPGGVGLDAERVEPVPV